jgi:hypothetical protein
MISTPIRGSQRERALHRANAVRTGRAALKRRVAAGELDAAEVILACPFEANTMVVHELLMAQPLWGHVRATRLLNAIPLTERKTIGSMTERQRRSVAALLALHPDG